MIGKSAVALLERPLDLPHLKRHCIIHQEPLCGIFLNLQHVITSVEKCVNKIRARGLNRKEFREYCGLLDTQYGDIIHHCEMRRLSRGQVHRRFWKLNNIEQDYLEGQSELLEDKLSCVIKNVSLI